METKQAASRLAPTIDEVVLVYLPEHHAALVQQRNVYGRAVTIGRSHNVADRQDAFALALKYNLAPDGRWHITDVECRMRLARLVWTDDER